MSFIPLAASIDIGTTSTRAILFARDGSEIAKHQIEYTTSASVEKAASSTQKESSPTPVFSAEGVAITAADNLVFEDSKKPSLLFPNPGWVECVPSSILADATQCLGVCMGSLEALNKDAAKPYKVTAIGITNMRETTVVWSKKTGKAYHNGIVWNDTRTSAIVQKKIAETPKDVQEKLRRISGVPISTYFSASKLRWFIDNCDNVKAAYDRADGDLCFGTIDTWLIFQLTKERSHVSDVTNASRTMFMNLDTFNYDKELLDLWDINPKNIVLPKIVSSSEYYGAFKTPNLAAIGHHSDLPKASSTWLDALTDIPICGCLGDQSASLVGQLTLKAGAAKCTYGTGAFLLYNTGPRKLISEHGPVTTLGFWFPELESKEDSQPHYALEGSIAVAGSVVQWLRDNLKMIEKAQDVGPLASQVDNTGGAVFVPAFSGLFAPYWDSEARGTILGLTQYTNACHIARAALEGVCYQTRAILKAMGNDAGANGDFMEDLQSTVSPLSVLAVDGGMSKSDEVMQIQADILGPCVTVKRSPNAECTALGAAIAAGLYKHTVWSSLEDVTSSIVGDGSNNEFKAQLADDKRRAGWTLWEKAVERSRGWLTQD
ncbi:hypothetical protein BABINDRAFT_160866 [Babjeviella inositovora NRRL Y-12698]|uniref:glycerol kinase n=1 Tax=Babjeviella inositovora NRRL Y-12698 TaxID=984486 RepID=A0A1E3QSE0_9ASCO|nr:uncharacterized protein BABINDRAFT_160866 [Babjeviella inositovora NRRL Y-12698]ODQ80609.1 hypothetical protein BABINDRAFT_160866 [Babjeviella inositovora NRRL Y-12698]